MTRAIVIQRAARDNSKGESSKSSLSSSQRNLLLGLDRLREEGEKRRHKGADGPPDFVVIKPAKPQSQPVKEEANLELEDDDSQDGGKFWREVSGVGDEEEEDEFEEGEEEEEEEEEQQVLDAPQETDEEGKLRDLYSTPGKTPPRFVSSKVEIRAVKGSGRGMLATSAIDVGALVLTSYPLGIVYCEEGSTPENEELGDQLLSETKLSAPQLTLLSCLDDGSGKDLTSEKMMISMDILDSSAAATLVGSRGGSPGRRLSRKEGTTAPAASVSNEQLYAIVNRNAFGEEFLDIATSVMRGEDSLGHLGLWPEAALTNHSCSPNSTSLTLGNGALMVRATEDIAAGQEITLNWLGQLLTGNHSMRADLLPLSNVSSSALNP
jgi:hypothetical protein